MELAIIDAGTLAKSLIDDGITAMKWAFTDHYADINRGTHISNEDLKLLIKPVEEIRRAVGDQIEVANDGHGRWNLNSAIRIGKAMDHLDMMWQEELIQPTNVDSHLKLADEVEAPICVSERLISKYQFREYLKAGAAEVVMPDLIWTGGITETKKICTMAEAEQRPVAPHDMTGPVNVFACAHISITDEPGNHFHWGGHESPMFEVTGERGKHVVSYRKSWAGSDPDMVLATDNRKD